MNQHDTAERLADALNATADTVPDHARPSTPWTAPRKVRRPWRWPAAMVVTATAAAKPPPYFVALDNSRITVYDARTGQRTATVPDYYTALALAPDGRTVFAARNLNPERTLPEHPTCDTRLERLTLDTKGKIAAREAMGGTETKEGYYRELAISPDGRQLAFTFPKKTGTFARDDGIPRCDAAARIELNTLDLGSGELTVRVPELIQPNNPVWAADNRTVYFVDDDGLGLGEPEPVIRAIDTRTSRSSEDSRVLTDQDIEVAGLGKGTLYDLTPAPDAKALRALFSIDKNPGDDLDRRTKALVEISTKDGRVTVLDPNIGEQGVNRLTADATGRHLLVASLTSGSGASGDVLSGRPSFLTGLYADGKVTWAKGAKLTEGGWQLDW